MTKFDREHALADNRRYAVAVLAALAAEFPGVERWALAGFSQGVAMAYRAAAGAPRPPAALVVLAGDVPPDVAADGAASLPPVLVARGSEDAWYDAAKMDADLVTLAAAGVAAEPFTFAGGHEWHPEMLARAGEFLRRRFEG